MPDLWVDVDTAVTVPVNILPLLDDTDFKTIEQDIAYNAAGMDLVWNFQTAAGVTSCTAVTPTTGGGDHDWAETVANKGMYKIGIPASGGDSISNDTEGIGWFTGVATGVLPWRGPTIGFRRAALNDLLMDGGTASTNLEDFFDGTGYAGGTTKLNVDVVAISGDTNSADNLEAATDGNTYNVGGGAIVAASVTGAVGSVTGAVGSVTGAVGSVTGFNTTGSGLSAIPWNAAWDAEVESEANDALIANNLDHLALTATASADMTTEVADNTVLSRILANGDTSVFDPSTDGLRSIRSTVDSIGSGTGAALNFAADDDNTDAPLKSVTFVGSQANTYANTAAEDGTRHSITDSGGTPDIDIVYRFSIGAGRNAAKVVWKGYVTNGDTVTVQAYNGSTWDTRATITGTTSTSNTTRDIALLATHTGTGADAGLVHIRFTSSGQSAIVVNTDELLVSGVSVGMTVGYLDGLVWVDATNGTAGTTPFVHGTADNPCTTIAEAYSIAAAVGLTGIHVAAGTTLTLTQSADKWTFAGPGRIALGGQSIADAMFTGLYTISGTSTGDDALFDNCGIGDVTIYHAYLSRCRMKGTLTMAASQAYFFDRCFDANESSDVQTLVFAANATAMLRDWHGGVKLDSMAATNECIIDGAGRLQLTDTSVGGTVTLRGFFPPVTGGVGLHSEAEFVAHGGTLTQTARYATDVINAQADLALTDYDPPTNTEMEARTLVAANYFDPAADAVANVTTVATVTNVTNGVNISSSGVQAIWDALTSALTTVNSIGKLIVTNLDAAISTRSTYAGADTAGTTTLLGRIIGILAAGTHNAQSGDAYARIGAPTGLTVSADIADVEGKVDDLETRLTAARAGYLDNLSAGAVATAAALTAVDDYVDTEITSIKAVTDKLNTTLVQDGAVYDFTAAALAAAPVGGGAAPTVGDIDAQLSATHGAGAWGAGTGATSQAYNVTVGGLPADGVYCRMTTDAAGLINIAAGTTDAAGNVTFWHNLASGTTVYIWRVKAGISFTDPDTETIP